MTTTYVLDTGNNMLDTWINSTNDDTNGGNVNFEIGRIGGTPDKYLAGLVKWNDIANGFIPYGKPVVSATLGFYLSDEYAPSAAVVEVYRPLRLWSSVYASGSHYNSTGLWTTAGARGLGTDIEASPIGTLAMDGSPTEHIYYYVPLDPYRIYEMINGIVPNYGFLVRTSDASPDGWYLSLSEEFSGGGYECKLTVTVTEPVGGIMGLL